MVAICMHTKEHQVKEGVNLFQMVPQGKIRINKYNLWVRVISLQTYKKLCNNFISLKLNRLVPEVFKQCFLLKKPYKEFDLEESTEWNESCSP